MIIRCMMVLAAAVVAVLLLKAVVAVAILAAVAFGSLFSFNVARRAILRSTVRPVAPLARPNISVRR